MRGLAGPNAGNKSLFRDGHHARPALAAHCARAQHWQIWPRPPVACGSDESALGQLSCDSAHDAHTWRRSESHDGTHAENPPRTTIPPVCAPTLCAQVHLWQTVKPHVVGLAPQLARRADRFALVVVALPEPRSAAECDRLPGACAGSGGSASGMADSTTRAESHSLELSMRVFV